MQTYPQKAGLVYRVELPGRRSTESEGEKSVEPAVKSYHYMMGKLTRTSIVCDQ